MPGAMWPARPWERDEHEMMNQLELAKEWRCGLPTAPRDVATMLAARSLLGRWRRWRQVTETMGRSADRSHLGDACGESGRALIARSAGVRHGCD